MKAKVEVHDPEYFCVVRLGGANGVIIHARSADKLAMKTLSKSVHGSVVSKYKASEINKLVVP